MPEYRRNHLPGGSFFFTVNLADRSSDILVREIELLRLTISATMRRRPFVIAWVALPEHMHCLWTLPEGDADYSGRWRAIKKAFSKTLPGIANARGERDIWQSDSGNTPFVTNETIARIWITSISTRSSTATSNTQWNGRIPRFENVWNVDYTM